MAAAIVRAGGRALVLAEAGRLAGKVAACGGEVMPFPAGSKNPLRMLVNAHAIAARVGSQGVDLIHARSRAPAWSALIAARIAKVPFVTTYHGAYSEKNAIKRIYNSVMARGDVVIANSRFTANLIAERYGTPRERIVSIHRGVDSRRFDPEGVAPGRVAALLARWKVAPTTRLILHAARLTAWKGQRVLIEAAALLHRAGRLDGACVILAGDAQGRDGYERMLQKEIAAAGLEEHVRLTGHVEDMAAAYRAAHVCVIASTSPEAFGRTAIEAGAMQCPVVATAIGAPAEIILAPPAVAAEAATGWLVPAGNPRALADRLAEALALPGGARAEMGRRGRRHVIAQFAVAGMQGQTLGIYDRLLGTTLERRFLLGGDGDGGAGVADRDGQEKSRDPKT
jgi:glycosyltransferase involved in cell wall biosynthesis